jgi:hypothetical protein
MDPHRFGSFHSPIPAPFQQKKKKKKIRGSSSSPLILFVYTGAVEESKS